MAGPGEHTSRTRLRIPNNIMKEGTEYRITLNNHTQRTPTLNKPEYENTSTGKSSEAIWTSVVLSRTLLRDLV